MANFRLTDSPRHNRRTPPPPLTLNLNLRLRPVRFGFVVRPEDGAAISRIFRVNTCLWGGQYNPIIPYLARLPRWWDRHGHRFETAMQIVEGYLDFFEPDILVEAERGIAAKIGFDKDRVIQLSEVLVDPADRLTRGYGLPVFDLYRELYKTEFQFLRRHKPGIVRVKAAEVSLRRFSACVFGEFPQTKALDYLEKAFKDAFDPEAVTLDPASLAKLYRSEGSSPLDIGRLKLEVHYNTHDDPTFFVLDAKEPRDLIDFWNLRATCQDVIAIPAQWLGELADYCKESVTRTHRPLPDNSHGVMISTRVMFSRSIPSAEIEGLFQKGFQTANPRAAAIQAWYPPIWRPSPEFMVRSTRPTVEAEENSLEVTYDPDRPEIRFSGLQPAFAHRFGGTHRWVNVVRMRDWSHANRIASVFPCDPKRASFPRLRLGIGRIVSTTEGLIAFADHKGIPESWTLMDGPTAISEWLKERNITTSFSTAGRATQQVIQTMGGFFGTGKLAHVGIVRLLDEMSRRPITRSVHVQEFKNKVDAAVGNDIWRSNTFETLVERKAVELGLELKCPKCDTWGWHPLSQLDYSVSCELCLRPFAFPVANPTASESARWAYGVVGPFALPDFARGGYSAALAIRFFSEVIGSSTSSAVTWSSGQKLRLPTGKETEADFILWYQRREVLRPDYPTEVVFGEAKSFGKEAFEEKDVERLRLLADTFPGAILVFATMKEAADLSKREIKLIRQLAEWGREFDRERLGIRAPVVLLTGTELFTAHSLEATWRDKGGKHAHLVQHPSVRLDILQNMADLTQQLYLGMPPYHAWLETRRRKRLELTRLHLAVRGDGAAGPAVATPISMK